jgi:hypothetical protein
VYGLEDGGWRSDSFGSEIYAVVKQIWRFAKAVEWNRRAEGMGCYNLSLPLSM